MVCLKVAPHLRMRRDPSGLTSSSAGTRMQHSTFRPPPWAVYGCMYFHSRACIAPVRALG
eukprot:scaffold128331_cov43-Prasinocladus_malaysianus.AAC.1